MLNANQPHDVVVESFNVLRRNINVLKANLEEFVKFSQKNRIVSSIIIANYHYVLDQLDIVEGSIPEDETVSSFGVLYSLYSELESLFFNTMADAGLKLTKFEKPFLNYEDKTEEQ